MIELERAHARSVSPKGRPLYRLQVVEDAYEGVFLVVPPASTRIGQLKQDIFASMVGNNETSYEYRRLHRLSPSLMALACVGFACYSASGVFDFSPSLYLPLSVEAQALLETVNPFCRVIQVLLLLAIALYTRRCGSFLERPKAVVATCSINAAGCVVLFAFGLDATFWAPGVVIGSLMKTFGAFQMVLWCEFLCRARVKTIATILAGSYLICFSMVGYLALNETHSTTALISLLPFISMVVLLLLSREKTDECQESIRLSGGFPLKEFLAISIFGVAQSLVNAISEQRIGYSVELNTVISGGVASLVVLIVLLIAITRLSATSIARLFVPVLTISMLLVLIAEPGFQKYESYAIGAGYAVYRIFAVCLWCLYAQRCTLNVAFVLALGQAIQCTCNIAEKPLEALLVQTDAIQSIGIAIIIVGVLSAALFMFGDGKKEAAPSKGEPADGEVAQRAQDSNEDLVAAAAKHYGLTQREQELCLLILEGKSTDEICAEVFISPATFKTHMRNVYGKLQVHSRQELVKAITAE